MSENNSHVTKSEFAQMLNLNIRTLQRRLKAMGIHVERGLICPTMQALLRAKIDAYGCSKVRSEE